MSESFINKPPANPDEDTVYTMGGLDALPAEDAGGLDLGQFIGSAAQLAQLYPGSQNRPQYQPGLTDIRFTRSFQGASPGGSFYSPSGAGNAPAPSPSDLIIYQQPLIQPQAQAGMNEALLGGLLGMDWSGAYQDYLDKLEAQTQDVNISNVFTPTNTFTPEFNPVYNPQTDIEVSPTISNVNTVSPNINVSQSQTQTQTQQQRQQQSQGGGGLDSLQDQVDDTFDTNDFLDYLNSLPRTTLQQIIEQVTGTTSVRPSVSVRTSTVPTSITPYTSVVGITTITDSFPVYDPNVSDETSGGGLPDFFTEPSSVVPDTIVPPAPPAPSPPESPVISPPAPEPPFVEPPISNPPSTTPQVPTPEPEPTPEPVAPTEPLPEPPIRGGLDELPAPEPTPQPPAPQPEPPIVEPPAPELPDVSELEEAARLAEEQRRTAFQPSGPTGDLGNGVGASTKEEFDRFGDVLNLEDLGNPNLTPTDQLYLAGLAYNQNPNEATRENYFNWYNALNPETFEPGGPTSDVGGGLVARSKEEYDRFGSTLNLNDLGNPDLSLTDQLYLAGLAYSQEPNAATRENYYNWYKAMTPEDQATPEQLAQLRELESQVKADRIEAQVRPVTAPVVDQATSKFQSDIANAVSQRDNLLNQYNAAISQGASPQVISELQAGFNRLDQALSNYNVSEILSNPDFAREQAFQAGSKAIEAFTDPNNLPPPEAVDSVLSNVIDTVGADIIAENISEEGAQAILQAVGGDVAGEIAGDIAGPVAAALVSLAQGESAGTAISEAAKAYAVAQIAAIPGVGPFIAAAIALDSVLSGVLGYDSPINEAVAGAAENIDKAFSFVGRSIGSDPIGGISNWASGAIGSDPLGGVGRAIGRVFGFQEGGLVDLPGDSMYNDDYEGVLPDLMGFARGGVIPLPGGGKIAKGPGGGLDDLIPTSIDGRRAAALSDGEFVIPADVVSMMGDGSSNAGSKRLYDLVRQVRQAKTGTSRQAGPLQVGKILERTMR